TGRVGPGSAASSRPRPGSSPRSDRRYQVLVDYSRPPHPTPAALNTSGATGVSRYLSWLPNSKVIDAAEYTQLRAAGLDVMLKWECDERDFVNSGFDAAGAAAEALRQADVLGYPADCAIYFSVDFDASAQDWATIRGRFQAVNRVIGLARTGVYGPYD